jgi:hypothetical protein
MVNTTGGAVGQIHNCIDTFTTVSQPDIYVFHTASMVFYPHWGRIQWHSSAQIAQKMEVVAG